MKTVLIVEDMPSQAFIIQNHVVNCGYLTVASTDPFLSIEIVKMGGVDVVITDLNMPYMNGLELIKGIRSINKKIHIILITAYCHEENRKAAIQAGANHYVCKPIDFKTITELLNSIK